MDIFFFEAFDEEAKAFKNLMPAEIDAGYTWKTIQEFDHHGEAPAPLRGRDLVEGHLHAGRCHHLEVVEVGWRPTVLLVKLDPDLEAVVASLELLGHVAPERAAQLAGEGPGGDAQRRGDVPKPYAHFLLAGPEVVGEVVHAGVGAELGSEVQAGLLERVEIAPVQLDLDGLAPGGDGQLVEGQAQHVGLLADRVPPAREHLVAGGVACLRGQQLEPDRGRVAAGLVSLHVDAVHRVVALNQVLLSRLPRLEVFIGDKNLELYELHYARVQGAYWAASRIKVEFHDTDRELERKVKGEVDRKPGKPGELARLLEQGARANPPALSLHQMVPPRLFTPDQINERRASDLMVVIDD